MLLFAGTLGVSMVSWFFSVYARYMGMNPQKVTDAEFQQCHLPNGREAVSNCVMNFRSERATYYLWRPLIIHTLFIGLGAYVFVDLQKIAKVTAKFQRAVLRKADVSFFELFE